MNHKKEPSHTDELVQTIVNEKKQAIDDFFNRLQTELEQGNLTDKRLTEDEKTILMRAMLASIGLLLTPKKTPAPTQRPQSGK